MIEKNGTSFIYSVYIYTKMRENRTNMLQKQTNENKVVLTNSKCYEHKVNIVKSD